MLAFLLVVTPVVGLLTFPARAVDLTLFELDGNPTESSSQAGEDASTLRLTPGTSNAVAILDTIDPVNSNLDVTFDAGGGANTAKDLGDISEWRWVSKATQDKLDLRDVLSAQYRGPQDEPHLYLAATRFGGTGTSTVGFWFLQQTIELGPNGTFVNAENPSQLGRHVEGDVLVVADFESSSNKLDIYEWRSGAPVLVYSTTLTCAQAGTERACGVANAAQVPSPWPLQLKSAPPNVIPTGQYLEVGLDLGLTFGANLGCYQSVVVTSRSSSQLTATLNDLVMTGSELCGIKVEKTGPAQAAAGETITYRFSLKNTGIVPITLDSVVDDVLGNLTAAATAAGCGRLLGGDTCTFTADYTVPAARPVGPLTNTVTATYSPPNRRTPTKGTASHTVDVYRPAVSLTKTAEPAIVNPGDPITYTYVVTNATGQGTRSAPPLVVESLGDTIIGSIDVSSCGPLAVGASCTVTAIDNADDLPDPRVNIATVIASPSTARAIDVSAQASASVVINDPPVAGDDTAATPEDTTASIAVLSNDSDPESNLDITSVSIDTQGTKGSATVGAGAVITYTPYPNVNGTDTVVYKVCDVMGLCDTATITIAITPVPDAPIAVDDEYSTPEDTTLTIVPTGVLENDSDSDGDGLVVASVDTSGLQGDLAWDEDGSFVYTPPADFHGTTSFDYTVSDGTGRTDTATVTIAIDSVNDFPAAVNDGYSTDEDTVLTVAAPGLLANDSDVDLDTLTVQPVTDTVPGDLTVGSNGNVTFDPAGQFEGLGAGESTTVTFVYVADDSNGGTASATVTITIDGVNDDPEADPEAAETDEETPISVTVLDAGDTDPDTNDVLSVDSIDTTGTIGVATLLADGTVEYDPNGAFDWLAAGESTTDTFTYTITDDNGGTATASVTVTIFGVNDPVDAVDDTYSTAEDTVLNVAAPGVLDNDSDVDATDVLMVTVHDTTTPNGGTVAMNPDGSFTYTPAADFTGDDTFTYTVSDGKGSSDTATVTVTVDPRNDPPVAVDDGYPTDEDTSITIDAPGVLFNDSDVDGDTLGVTAVDLSGTAGLATIDSDGKLVYDPNGAFESLGVGDSATDSFGYTVCDPTGACDTATVTITIAGVNDGPVAQDDAFSTVEDTTLTVDVPGILGNDSDVDGGNLVPTVVSGVSNGSLALNPNGSFTYTPDTDFTGSDGFSYQISDGRGGSATATVTITVDPINDPPVAEDDGYSTDEDTALIVAAPGVLANDSDVDDPSAALSAVLVTDAAYGTVSLLADGTFQYVPDPDFYGPDSFTYRTSDDDGALSNVATVTITVNPVDDVPLLEVAKSASDSGPEVGDTIVYSITVDHADGSDGSPVSGIDVSDPMVDVSFTGGDTNSNGLLDDGETWTYTASYTVRAEDPDEVINTATATGTDVDGDPVSATGSATVDVAFAPVLEVTKTAGTASAVVGDTLSYTITASHSLSSDGSPVEGPIVSDPNADTVAFTSGDDGDGLLESGETWTWTATRVVLATDPTPLDNTATVTGTDGDGEEVTGSAGDSVAIDFGPVITFSKVADRSIAAVGETVNYTITAEHAAGSDGSPVASVSVTDPTADALGFTGGDDGDGLLEAGETWTWTATRLITSSDPAVVTNAARIDGVDRDGEPVSETAAVDVATYTAGVVIDKTGPAFAVPGDGVTYTFTITNTGGAGVPDLVIGSVVDDVLGDLTSAAAGAGCGSVAAGTPCTFTVGYTVPALDAVRNNVSVSATPAGGSIAVTDDDSHTLLTRPDLAISIDDGDVSVAAGDPITYTIEVSNLGAGAATGVEVTVSIPADTTAAANPGWSCGATTCVATVGTLAGGASSTLTFEVVVDDPLPSGVTSTSITSTVNGDGARPDADPSNDTDGDTTPLVAAPDLTVSIDDGAESVVPGTSTSYAVAYGNAGAQDALGAEITITVPSGTALSGTGWSCVPDASAGSTCAFVIGDLDAGASGTAGFTLDVAADATGTLVATVTISDDGANGADLEPLDNTATDVDALTPSADLEVAKAASSDPVPAGGELTYTLTVSNVGPSTATGVVVTDELPAGVTYLSDDSSGAYDPGTGLWTVGTLDPAASATLEIVVSIDPATVGDVVNTATAAGDVPDPDGATSSVTVTVTSADLELVKSVDDTTPAEGETITYTITVRNDGPDGATGVVVTDVLPAGVTYAGDDSSGGYDDASGEWAVGDLSSGSTATLAISAIVDAGTSGATITNAVSVTDAFPADPDGAFASVDIAVNVPPDATDDTMETDEDTPIDIEVLANDSDTDGTIDPTTVSVTSPPSNGLVSVDPFTGQITYEPGLDFNGTDEFEYTVCDDDGDCDTALVTITVVDVNDPPVAEDDTAGTDEDEAVEVVVTVNDTDADGTVVPASVTIVDEPSNGSVSVDPSTGVVTYTPDPDFNGTDTFTYTVEDDEGATSNEATVTVTVADVNDRPVATDGSYATDAGTVVSGNVVTEDTGFGLDFDPDGTLQPAASVATPPSNGLVTLNPNGAFAYTPGPGFSGTDTFTYTVTDDDGASSDPATVTITVDPVPDPGDDTAVTDEDTAVDIDVLDNDTGLESGGLVVTIETDPLHGTSTVDADGSVTYQPFENYSGLDSFVYQVCDEDGDCGTATVTVTVSPVNDPPVAENDVFEVDEETATVLTILDNDSDPVEGTPINPTTVAIMEPPAHGTVEVNADGTVTYTPGTDFSGADGFVYLVCDSGTPLPAECDVAGVDITVSDLNDRPVALPNAYTIDEDTEATGNVVTDDTGDSVDFDVDGTLVPDAVVVDGVAHGTLVLQADGSFTYTPAPDFTGTDSFTYTVTDEDGGVSDPATVTVIVSPVDDLPVAEDDAASVDEDDPVGVVIAVLGNDSVGDGPGSVAIETDPANGAATTNPDGTITYIPDPDFSGEDSFTYELCDIDGDCTIAGVTVTVDPVNDPPLAVDDGTYPAVEDEALAVDASGGVLPNDEDVDGDPLTVTAGTIASASGGSVALASDGSFTYTPPPDYHGPDSFTYEVCDPDGLCDEATVTLDIGAVNDLPQVADDSYTSDEDTLLSVPVPGVLANDSDVDGDTLTVLSVDTFGLDGALSWAPDGSFVFTPDEDFTGETSFVYTVTDPDGETASAIVTIVVNPIPDPPLAVDDSVTTDEDTAIVIPVSDNDSDPDGDLDPATVTIVDAPKWGQAEANDDGTVTYTPNPDFNGSDSFTYEICDVGERCDRALVSIEVAAQPDPPVANDDAETTDEDTSVTVAVLVNDSDPDGDLDPASLQIVDGPAFGSASIDGILVVYTPDGETSGTVTITYEVCDLAGACDQAQVVIVVNPANDAPDAVDDEVSTEEDSPLTFDPRQNDDDLDDDPITIAGATQPAAGTGTVTFTGTNVTFTPAPNFVGAATFTYTICDPSNACDTATVTVSVDPVNDPPDARNDVATTDEDTPVVVAVLENDDDIDGDAVSILSATDGTHGSVTINGDGTITYTPLSDFSGEDSFTYTIGDDNGGTDTATVLITVNEVNDSPSAVDDSAETGEDTPVVVAVLDNDDDPDGDELEVDSVTDGAHGSVTINADNTVTYTPALDYFGTDTFTYTITDGRGGYDTASVTVTIEAVDDAPVANDDIAATTESIPVAIPVLDNDSDPEDDLVTVTDVSDPGGGSAVINADGTITYTPDPGFVGDDTFTYTITANGLTDTATVTVSVGAGSPPLAGDDEAAVDEDSSVDVPVLGNDEDPDGGSLTVTGVSDPANGSATVNPDGTITYVPDPDFTGSDGFTYTVCDPAGDCASAGVRVTVNPVNDDPVARDDEYSTDEDTQLVVGSPGVLDNDDDIDGDRLEVDAPAVYSTDQGGTVEIFADGSFVYDPPDGYSGTDGFSYVVTDGAGGSATATVSIEVSAINDPPVAEDDSASVVEDGSVDIDVIDNDADPDGDPIMVSSVAEPSHGEVVVNPDGTITYTPAPDFNGTDSFFYTVCDDGRPAECDTARVDVTVEPINDDPIAGDDSVSVDEGASVIVDVIDNDSDPDGDTLEVVSVTEPANGTATLNPDGTVTYVPSIGFTGPDSFDYTITDGNGGTDTATVSVIVNSTNRAPLAVDDDATTPEDSPVEVDVSANDSDPDGDDLAVTSVTQPVAGTVSLVDGIVTFTPVPDQTGDITFTYTICDSEGACDTAEVTVTIEAENDPPVVVDESITTDEDTPVVIDLLANDSDPDGDLIDVSSITQASNGVAELGSGGAVTYTPEPGFVGEDGFTYEVCDGSGACTEGRVSITVRPLDLPPVAGDDLASTDVDAPVAIAVLANDVDPEGLALTVTGTSAPSNGTVEVNSDGTITYTPASGFTGLDGFGYTACDPAGNCDIARVTVTVGDVPLGNVSGQVWLDANGDGVIDDGEIDISGVRVELVHAGPDGELDTEDDTSYPPQVTASPYLFTGIPAGPARVSIALSTLPPRLAATFDEDGGLDSAAIVAVVVNDTVYADFGFILVNRAPDLAPGSPTELTAPVGGGLAPLDLVDPDGDATSATLAAGSLPPGITLGSTGVFSGAATSPGSFPIVVTICDDFTPQACTDRELTIVISAVTVGPPPPPPPPPPSPDPTPIPDILPLPDATTTTIPAESGATSTTIQPAEAPGSLPFTGAALAQLLLAGLALLGLGAGTLRRGRRD